MTIVELTSLIEVVAAAAKVPFAAISLAVCVYCALRVAALKGQGPESGVAKLLPWLGAILVVAAAIRIFLYPHNAGLMNDEFYYAQNARWMIDPTFNPINQLDVLAGWPMIISLGFWAVGPDQYAMFYTNAFIGTISTIALFFLVYGATGRLASGVVAAFFLALNPFHSIWSTCGAADVSATFFMIVSLAALFWFFRLHHVELIYLSLYAAAFASQIAVENLLLFVFIPVAIYVFSRDLFVPKIVARNLQLPTLLVLPSAVAGLLAYVGKASAMGAEQNSIYGYSGLSANIVDNLVAYIAAAAGGEFFTIILVFAAAGLLFGLKKDNRAILFFLAIGVSYIVASSVYSGQPSYIERFLLSSEIVLLAIGGFGVKALVERFPRMNTTAMISGLILAVVFSFGFHLRNISPDNDYFQYGKEISKTIDWINAEVSQQSTLIVEDPAPYQFSSRINVMTPGMAAIISGDIPEAANVYMVMDISAVGMADEFCDMFSLKKEKPIEIIQNIKPCGLDFGVYSVSSLASDTRQLTPESD